MAKAKFFLDAIGTTIQWIDFSVQALGVFIRFILFYLLSLIFPFCGRRDFDWKLKPRLIPGWVFVGLWLGSVVVLFWSLKIVILAAVLGLEWGWSLYALVSGRGERRREIFFHTLAVQFLSLAFFYGFLWGTELTHWHHLDVCRHQGNREAWFLVAFLAIRVGLFPFHVNRLDFLCEMPAWWAFSQSIFNSWIIFQVGLLMKSVAFNDAFGDWSMGMIAWGSLSFLFAIGLTAMQVRTVRLWAHLYWIFGHLALYLAML